VGEGGRGRRRVREGRTRARRARDGEGKAGRGVPINLRCCSLSINGAT
jgi:hypothetical protein